MLMREITAGGSIRTTEQAIVNVKDLNMRLKDSPVILRLGQPCEEHGYSCEWSERKSPNLFTHGQIGHCRAKDEVSSVSPDGSVTKQSMSVEKLVSQRSAECTRAQGMQKDANQLRLLMTTPSVAQCLKYTYLHNTEGAASRSRSIIPD